MNDPKIISLSFIDHRFKSMSVMEALSDFIGVSTTFIKKHTLKKYKKQLKEKVNLRKTYEFSINIINYNEFNPTYSGPKLKIIEDNSKFLVLYKEKYVHCSSLVYDEQNTIYNFLRNEGYFEILNINKNDRNRTMLNRLDFLTCGVLIFCKNEVDYLYLRENYDCCVTEKIYHAWCEGIIDNDSGELMNYLVSCGTGNNKVKVVESSDLGQKAILCYKVLERNEVEQKTKVKIYLKTGLRHQIRVQLMNLGHPLVDDPLYASKGKGDNFFLEALKYSIVLQGKRYIFQI